MLEDDALVNQVADEFQPQIIVHLAAQAGVRHSITHPHDYIDSNVTGTLNVLEGCRHTKVGHLVYASTSSAYGLSTDMPFSPQGTADHPAAIYAASKRANELMAHSYSHLFGLPTTGLRFFTVYGPWGRPDMALFLFTRKMLELSLGSAVPVIVFDVAGEFLDLPSASPNGMLIVGGDKGHPEVTYKVAVRQLELIANGRASVVIDISTLSNGEGSTVVRDVLNGLMRLH